MEQIAAIGDEETALGFKLAGVTHAVACNKENADEKMRELLSREGIGLVLLNQDLMQYFSHKTRRAVETSTKPVVITIIGKTTQPGGVSSLALLIKRAMGIDLERK